MLITGASLWRKVAVTAIAAVAFAAIYDVTIHDSNFFMREMEHDDGNEAPAPGQRLTFAATAYCKGLATTSGVAAQAGVAAGDPSLLPIGSVIQLDTSDGKYDGIYTVLDTGPSVQGRALDLYMWNCYEALRFGRQTVHVTVLRLGWNPRAVTPSLLDRIFKRSDGKPSPLPSRPLPLSP